MMDIHKILTKLPHRYPFLLVDRVLDIDMQAKTIRAIKNITVNEPCFTGHFPVRPVFPGVLMLEALAQGCLLLAHPLHFPFQRDALAVGLLPLLVKLLVLGRQLAQLLTHPLQLLLTELGLTQLLLALGQPLLQRLATAEQGAHQLVPLNRALA